MSELDPSVTTSGEMTGAECPYCGSTDTEREHPCGPSRCQSIHYCNECIQQFKKFEYTRSHTDSILRSTPIAGSVRVQ